MQVMDTNLRDVKIIEPEVFSDDRGFFFESYNSQAFNECIGLKPNFVQDNHSRSMRGVLRGLHYQIRRPQGKLVRVISGEVYDVAVDLRKYSPTFGQWEGVVLSSRNKRQLWIPEGFAHGFLLMSDVAELLYKTTDYYAPEYERCISWDDSDLAIQWPLEDGMKPLLSSKDAAGVPFRTVDYFE